MTTIEKARDLANDRRDEFPPERIAALEAEKPAEDARYTQDEQDFADDIEDACVVDNDEDYGHSFRLEKAAQMIHSFAESYHAKKCAECKKKRAPYRPFGTDQLPEDRS